MTKKEEAWRKEARICRELDGRSIYLSGWQAALDAVLELRNKQGLISAQAIEALK